MFKRAMVWNTKRNNFILWKIKRTHLTGCLWRSFQLSQCWKESRLFPSEQRWSLSWWSSWTTLTLYSCEISWDANIAILLTAQIPLPTANPAEVPCQATANKFLVKKENLMNWEGKVLLLTDQQSAALEKYNNFMSWNLHFLEEKL